MDRRGITIVAAASAVVLLPSSGLAQRKDVRLHVDPRWDECAFVLDPALTQKAWHQFAAEAGVVTYFRPLADARPLGTGHFDVSLLRWEIGIDDTDAAWNDTFVHPDPEHWLFDGSRLPFPGLMVRAGVTDRIDVGAYFTQNVPSNYGLYGGQLQYGFLRDPESPWAASARASFMSLFGPTDLDFTSFGLDLVGSRDFALSRRASISPYAGVTGYLSRAHERTAAVNLDDETVPGAQAMFGAVARVSVARVAFEVSTARVNARSFRVGVAF
jgi:hypothetical protein